MRNQLETYRLLVCACVFVACRAPSGDEPPRKAHIAAAVTSSRLRDAPLLPPPDWNAAKPGEETVVTRTSLRSPALHDADAELPSEPRVYAKTRFVWVYPEPDVTRQWVGFLRSGNSAKLLSSKPRAGNGCDAFVAIAPKGFVCADGARATLSPRDPVYAALEPYATRSDSPTPHRYAESLGLPRYLMAPTPELQRMRENDLRSHLRAVEEARAGNVPAQLLGVDLAVPERTLLLPALPIPVFEDRKELKARSTVAYSTEARFGDRAFLLTGDFAWVPKDRVRPYPPIAFHGVELAVNAPGVAFIRKKLAAKYHREPDGQFVSGAEAFQRLSTLVLSGKEERSGTDRYYETSEPNVWLRAADGVIPVSQERTPWGEPLSGQEETPESRAAKARAPKGRATWIEVSIEGGWLLAYEGTRRVFATLISPGKGGVAKSDEDPLKRAATPTGVYPISGKFVTSTMEAPGDLIHSDVPFAQNLVGPYALHGAYWHDNWGNPQSGGCINLSPIDAKWLFDFTEPKLPPGWHGVRWIPSEGPATIVVLHR